MATTVAPQVKAKRERKKPPRFIRVLRMPSLTQDGLLRIRVGKETSYYTFHAIPTDPVGRAYRLTKVDPKTEEVSGESYACHVGAHTSCECKGFFRWSHCKHTAGLAELIKRRLI